MTSYSSIHAEYKTVPELVYARLREDMIATHVERFASSDDLYVGLQLTHSGRYSVPVRSIAYHNPHIDRKTGTPPDLPPVSDEWLERLEEVPGVKVFGPSAQHKGGVTAFTLSGVHPHDVAQILDKDGIAVRAGHHCAQPLHEKFGIPATSRASFYLYNTKDEVDLLVNGIYKVKELFG